MELNIKADIRHHDNDHAEIIRKLNELICSISKSRLELCDFARQMDDATTGIADQIDKLVLASAALTADEKNVFKRMSDKLKAMGKITD